MIVYTANTTFFFPRGRRYSLLLYSMLFFLSYWSNAAHSQKLPPTTPINPIAVFLFFFFFIIYFH